MFKNTSIFFYAGPCTMNNIVSRSSNHFRRYGVCMVLNLNSQLFYRLGSTSVVNHFFAVAPEVEVQRIKIRGPRWPWDVSTSPDPLPMKLFIEVVTNVDRKMSWGTAVHEDHILLLISRQHLV